MCWNGIKRRIFAVNKKKGEKRPNIARTLDVTAGLSFDWHPFFRTSALSQGEPSLPQRLFIVSGLWRRGVIRLGRFCAFHDIALRRKPEETPFVWPDTGKLEILGLVLCKSPKRTVVDYCGAWRLYIALFWFMWWLLFVFDTF